MGMNGEPVVPLSIINFWQQLNRDARDNYRFFSPEVKALLTEDEYAERCVNAEKPLTWTQIKAGEGDE